VATRTVLLASKIPHTVPMMTFIAAAVLLALFMGVLLWLFSLASPGRRGALTQAADQLNFSYEPWGALSRDIRRAGFCLLQTGEARYVPHYLHNEHAVLFDFTTFGGRQPLTQTLIIVPCPATSAQTQDLHLMMSSQSNISSDCFNEQRALPRLDSKDVPARLRSLALYARPIHKAAPALNDEAQSWLLSHSHLHIEWSAGMLLACQPGYLIEGEEIAQVVADVQQLADALRTA